MSETRSGGDAPRHIFVTGHARSGTTILMQALNTSPDVFLFSEAELYWYDKSPSFPEYFNKRAEERDNLPVKGYFVPSAVPPDTEGSSILDHMSRYYRLTGDKVALGPGRAEQVHLFHYLTGRHLDAFHIFTFRRPDAAVVSMHAMFPAIAARALLSVWLDTISLIACCLSVLPRSYVIPRERLDAESVARIAGLLGVDPVISTFVFRPERTLSPSDLEWLPPEQSSQLASCMDIYRELVQDWDPIALRFHNPFTYSLPAHFIGLLRKAIPEHRLLIDRIWEPINAATDVRRAALYSIVTRDHFGERERALIEDYARTYPRQALGRYALGLATLRGGQNAEKAIESFSLALEYGYPEFWVRFQRSKAYEKLKDYKNCLDDAERAVQLNPGHKPARQRFENLKRANAA